MKKRVIGLLVMATASLLGGCGDIPETTPTDTTITTTTTGGIAPNTVVAGVVYSLRLVPALNSLSAGGSTTVTATILADGVADTTQVVEVTFTSSCVAQAKATIDSPVISSAGVAISTYRDVKCASTDTVAASATIGGNAIAASTQIIVQGAELGSLRFLEATPPNIGIKGVGLAETSVIQFQVIDVLGQTAPAGQSVNFTLDTTMGGITLAPTSAVTDANGIATTTVTSGTVATTVRVKAELASNPAIQTQADGLVISTGISDQNSFSLSADVWNVEGMSYDGEQSTLTIRASDHFNNPVPDGAAVLFTTNGGQVVSSCVMTGGACSVTWTSQNPRPAKGRLKVLVSMTGEESFSDLNGNNRFDDNEPFVDLPEAWLDGNEDGVYNVGIEEFRDFNTNGTYTGADGKYNGILCAGPTLCGTSKSLDVRATMTLVMSESNFIFRNVPASMSVPLNSSQSATVDICGAQFGQVPPFGTKFEVTSSYGTGLLIGGDTMRNDNHDGCHQHTFTFEPNNTAPGDGVLEFKVTTPHGHVSYFTVPVNGY